MNPFLAGVPALAGLAAGYVQRALIFRYAVPAGGPHRRGCPARGHQIAAAGGGCRRSPPRPAGTAG